MLNFICAAVLFYPVIYDIVRCAATVSLKRRFSAVAHGQENISPEKIFIFLPAFREQRIVESIMHYWREVLEGNDNLEIFVLTTAREERERQTLVSQNDITHDVFARAGFRREDIERYFSQGKNEECLGTTTELARQMIDERKLSAKMRVLQYEGSETGKSSQLNHGVETLRAEGRLPEKVYLGVYDFDSRPDPAVFREIGKYNMMRDKPDILQQAALPLLALEKSSIFGVCDAYHHYVRTCFNEIMIWLLWNKLDCLFSLRQWIMSLYCVGIGLFIREDYFKRVFNDRFPTPVDDLPIGFKSANLAMQIRPLNAPCLIESYPNLPSAIRSRRLVFYAYVEEFFKCLKNPLSLPGTGAVRSLFFLIFSVPLYLASLFVLLVEREWAILTLAVVFYCAVSTIKMLLCCTIAAKHNARAPIPKLQNAFICLFTPIWRWIPACWALSSGINRNLAGKELKFSKTSRH